MIFVEEDTIRFNTFEQQLADIAAVQRRIQMEHNLTSTNQWIAFGASFSGILSIFYRQKYANLVTASVSSSAPIKTSFDGWKYFSNIGNQILNTTMGGSQECFDAVLNASMEVDNFIRNNNYEQLKIDFNLCETNLNLTDKSHQFSVALTIADVLSTFPHKSKHV
jgi:hypothetical protein